MDSGEGLTQTRQVLWLEQTILSPAEGSKEVKQVTGSV